MSMLQTLQNQRPKMIFCNVSVTEGNHLLTEVAVYTTCYHFGTKVYFVQHLFFVHFSSSDLCELHLDLNTAHKNVKLSEDNRNILSSDKAQKYPDRPERFNERPYILSRDGLYGRFYWEVECSGDEWAVGVCYIRIRRKGSTDDCALGFNKISWRLGYYQQRFSFIHAQEKIPFPVTSRIGVYLDHRAGTLSFYSVSDTMTLLHRVQTTFTEPVYPAFKVGAGSSARIIDPKKDQSPLFRNEDESSLYARVRFRLEETS